MTKRRKVTDDGVIKESTKMIRDRELAREGAGHWPEQPSKKERSIDMQTNRGKKSKTKKQKKK